MTSVRDLVRRVGPDRPARAISARRGEPDPTVEMLEADRNTLVSFSLLTARKSAR